MMPSRAFKIRELSEQHAEAEAVAAAWWNLTRALSDATFTAHPEDTSRYAAGMRAAHKEAKRAQEHASELFERLMAEVTS